MLTSTQAKQGTGGRRMSAYGTERTNFTGVVMSAFAHCRHCAAYPGMSRASCLYGRLGDVRHVSKSSWPDQSKEVRAPALRSSVLNLDGERYQMTPLRTPASV